MSDKRVFLNPSSYRLCLFVIAGILAGCTQQADNLSPANDRTAARMAFRTCMQQVRQANMAGAPREQVAQMQDACMQQVYPAAANARNSWILPEPPTSDRVELGDIAWNKMTTLCPTVALSAVCQNGWARNVAYNYSYAINHLIVPNSRMTEVRNRIKAACDILRPTTEGAAVAMDGTMICPLYQ